MHSEQDYSFSNYRKIQFSHHKFMLMIVAVLYVIIQTMTVGRLTFDEYGYHAQYLIVAFIFATIIALIMYRFRYRFDYVFYKYFFAKTHKRRYFYKHNQLVGPLLIYLVVYISGLFGIALLLILSKPGHDYRNFKTDVLALNHNFGEINMMISDLLQNPDIDDYDDALGFIKYNISMFNMYEIALFDEQAKTISYEQLVENIKG